MFVTGKHECIIAIFYLLKFKKINPVIILMLTVVVVLFFIYSIDLFLNISADHFYLSTLIAGCKKGFLFFYKIIAVVV